MQEQFYVPAQELVISAEDALVQETTAVAEVLALLLVRAGREHTDIGVGLHVSHPHAPVTRLAGVHEDVQMGLVTDSVFSPYFSEFLQSQSVTVGLLYSLYCPVPIFMAMTCVEQVGLVQTILKVVGQPVFDIVFGQQCFALVAGLYIMEVFFEELLFEILQIVLHSFQWHATLINFVLNYFFLIAWRVVACRTNH